MTRIAIFGVIGFLAACATPVSAQFPPSTSTVFAGEAARSLANQCSRISPGPIEGVWTPDAATIEALEAGLPALIEKEARRTWPQDKIRAFDYYRQYGGLVIGGRRIVYVNGFASEPIADGRPVSRRDPTRTWRNFAMGVCDGGPIVFGVEYDPNTKAFTHFAFNGAID